MMTFLVTSMVALSALVALTRLTKKPIRSLDREHNGSVQRLDLAAVVGRSARRLLRRPDDPERDRSVGYVVLALLGLSIFSPPAAVVGALSVQVGSIVRRRRAQQRHEVQLIEGFSEVIDIFVLGLGSGNTVAQAIDSATKWAPTPFGEAFSWCLQQNEHGRPLIEVLEDLPARLGPRIRPLTAALIAHDRDGAPIAQSLAQLASDTRNDRRRRAEAAARRLPVSLLFPLVVCVLPAFMLLTVVPVVAETLAGIDLFASP